MGEEVALAKSPSTTKRGGTNDLVFALTPSTPTPCLFTVVLDSSRSPV